MHNKVAKFEKIQAVIEIINEQEHLTIIEESNDVQVLNDKERLTKMRQNPSQNGVVWTKKH